MIFIDAISSRIVNRFVAARSRCSDFLSNGATAFALIYNALGFDCSVLSVVLELPLLTIFFLN